MLLVIQKSVFNSNAKNAVHNLIVLACEILIEKDRSIHRIYIYVKGYLRLVGQQYIWQEFPLCRHVL